MQKEVVEKSKGARKRGNNRTDSSALANAERPSDQLKETNPKKREPEQGLTTDLPVKRVKTSGSKKVGRQATNGPGDDRSETVGLSNLPRSSKRSKSSKLSEPSEPSKLGDKKRKRVDEQELAAETPRDAKRIKKTDSTLNKLQPRPATPK